MDRPVETARKVMRHGQYSGVIAIPTPFRKRHRLSTGELVKVYYDALLLIVPTDLEHLVQKRRHLIEAMLSP